ncbi:serine/threonine-protein kinase [Streptomyces hainanensis]|uniref:non-specific serine/threonine protein kinase n=1 Tax=Streptomyces hainanensis TaxID=402648 RepID=A0A4R4TFB9_9ACTN|nr:serine/threonine-protein kinase [Streptomyces hainanensis]TDC74946.1 serine/threonine protein kinase [Streptomyces hainanensis]
MTGSGTTRCDRPPCPGEVTATGYCDTCGRRPAAVSTAPARRDRDTRPGPTGTPPRASAVLARATGGEMTLPDVSVLDPSELIDADPRLPSDGRKCGKDGCREPVGVGYGDQPAAPTGYCPRCRHPYSFVPQLHRGDVLGGQYRVEGPVTHGGLGWIYLARDTRLDDHPVALKGLINAHDATALRVAEAERRFLTALDHPDIVRIINFVSWRDTGYLVMEFVSGRSLRELVTPAGQERLLGGPLRLEHVAVYGCRILDAIDYLHGRGLLYCDMKPDNVIHHGDRIKVIDLGGVRRIDDHDSVGVITPPYLPDEELYRAPDPAEPPAPGGGRRPRFTKLTDLYTVATTLRELVAAAEPGPAIAHDSFGRLLARATAPETGARFATAAEMAAQLRGIWREIHSLSTGEPHVAQSTVFSPGADPLHAGLGAVPPPDHWLRPPDRPAPDLDLAPPPPERVAVRLPVPIPHPAAPGPARELHTCATSLALGALDAAEQALLRACQLLGPAVARHDWRIAWHRGLLLLAKGDVHDDGAMQRALGMGPGARPRARHWFDAVCDALPGEPAPKLALGYCAERAAEPEAAERAYLAVWRRDPTDGAAAFGIVRIRLGRDDRAGALDVLDRVPAHAPHHGAARLAMVRVHVGWRGEQPPTAEDFRAAQRLTSALSLDGGHPEGEERVRLTAEVGASALRAVAAGALIPEELDPGPLLGDRPDERALRERLEAALRELAERARTREEHAALIDRANRVRPWSRF